MLLDTATVASRLNQFGNSNTLARKPVPPPPAPPPRSTPPPVILQLAYNNETTGVDHVQAHFGSAVAYTVSDNAAASYNLTILVHNLALSTGGNVTLNLTVGESAAQKRVVETTAGRGVVSTSMDMCLLWVATEYT